MGKNTMPGVMAEAEKVQEKEEEDKSKREGQDETELVEAELRDGFWS